MPAGQKITEFDPHIRVKDDGALANARHERLAILLSEGFEPTECLKAIGGGETPTQGKRRYGRRIFSDKTFIARVEVLKTQKEAMEADPVWGEAMWMVAQLWRSAALANDIRTMSEAVKLRVQIADKRVDPDAAPEEAAPTRAPGKPAAENPQSKGLPPAAIRDKLMRIGRKDEEDLDEDSEVAGEA